MYKKHFIIGDDFEYLKASRIYEKSIWKSPVFDAIKLLALEEILQEINPKKIIYLGNSIELHKSFEILCNNLGILYNSKIKRPFRRLKPYDGKLSFLPEVVKALFHLIYRSKNLIRYKKRKDMQGPNGEENVLFCLPFTNFNDHELKKNKYRSEFITNLPELIKDFNFNTIWLHYFVRSQKYTNDIEAINALNLMLSNRGEDDHRLLGEYANLLTLIRTFVKWLKITLISIVVKTPLESFQPHNSQVSLWPIMKNDWYRSLRGPDLINNLIYYDLFNIALKNINPQQFGFILYENQGFEKIFAYLWHKHNHGKLIGMIHSTVRFWDLRFSANFLIDSFSQPDILAVNGNGALNELKASGYQMDKLIKVEALRYGYLTDTMKQNLINSEPSSKILVLGDYISFDTDELMNLIANSVLKFNRNIVIHFKPHPNYSFEASKYPNLNIVFEKEELRNLIPRFSLAITTNKTTASIETYIGGLKTIVMLNNNDLNFSPLRGVDGVSFVSCEEDLVKAINEKENLKKNEILDYFFIDPNFKLWKKTLSSL